jgi:prevent-host-death family protein
MAAKTAILQGAVPHEYPIADAKDHLPEAVRAARAGESVTLTRRGRPVAALLSLVRCREPQAVRPGFPVVTDGIRRAAAREGLELLEADSTGLRGQTPGRDVDP